jgi:SAM-dependent methyltransferase
MQTSIKLNTDNFLHTNPSLYLAFNGEHDQSMAQFIHNLFQQYQVGPRVLDIGSGTGREAAYLTERGYEVTGLDNSEEMLEWAREHYPSLSFLYGEQSDFSLNRQFDAMYCVGSTFLYNFTNEKVLSSLRCFREHLSLGGLLYLDMRNAAFFLTREGQRWLTEELTEQRSLKDGTVVSMKTRFSIDHANQMLERDYCWMVEGYEPIREHLQHRLLFPQELVSYLTASGFRVVQLFDKPAPHTTMYDMQGSLTYGHDMTGTRMQIIAQAM